MKIKSFVVAGDAAHKDLGALVEDRVNAFLAANPNAKEVVVDVKPDLSTTFGKALVVVSYEGKLAETAKTEKPAEKPGPAN